MGFKKCCISNAVDGTDDILWNGSEEDGDVRSECEEDEGTDCEDGDRLVKADRMWHALCITINGKMFILADALFLFEASS